MSQKAISLYGLLLHQHYILKFQMKQTIKTKNYNAVVQIPYERLAKKPNWVKVPNCNEQQSESSYCKQTKTVIVPQCHSCNCHSSSSNQQNKVSLEMLEELQRAFETDMNAKNDRIKLLESQLLIVRGQLTENKNQFQKHKILLSNQQNKSASNTKQHQNQIAKLKKQLQLAQSQKQKLLRAKIIQFQNSFQQFQKNEQEKLQKLQKQSEQKLKQELSIQSFCFQEQKLKLKEQLTQLRLNLQYTKMSSDKQLERLNRTIADNQKQIGKLEEKIAENGRIGKQKEREYQKYIDEKSLEITKLLSQIQNIRKITFQHEQNTQVLAKENRELKQKISQLDINVQKHKDIGGQWSIKYATVSQQKHQLQQRLTNSQSQLQTQISRSHALSSKIVQLESLLSQKQQLLLDMKTPKTYEVKIQKIIDRQQYILSLQQQLQSAKRNQSALQEKIKQMEAVILAREGDIGKYRHRISELEEIIQKMKKYIEEKERSFAWIVEREIARDIRINQGEINKSYKVYPGEPKIYYNFKQIKQNQIPVLPAELGNPFLNLNMRIGQNQNIILQHISQNESGAILKEVSQSGMLKQAIMRQVNEDMDRDRKREIGSLFTGPFTGPQGQTSGARGYTTQHVSIAKQSSYEEYRE